MLSLHYLVLRLHVNCSTCITALMSDNNGTYATPSVHPSRCTTIVRTEPISGNLSVRIYTKPYIVHRQYTRCHDGIMNRFSAPVGGPFLSL